VCAFSSLLYHGHHFRLLPRDAMHSAHYAAARYPYVCPSGLSDCPTHAGILSERLNVSSNFSHRRVARPFWFLSRVSILTRDIDIANQSVRPSVRYVPVPDENGLTYCHSYFHRTVAQSFCFYRHQTYSRNSDGVTPLLGR